MKSILALFVLFSSVSAFAGNTYQNTGSSIKYDRQSHALVIGQSQRVYDSNGKYSHNRGIGTYIPLNQHRGGVTVQRGEPPVYHNGKRVK